MESDDNFQIDVKKLESLMFQRKKDMKDAIDSTYGGVDSLIKLLKSSQEAGIASNNAAVRSKLFGRNVIEVEKPKTFFKHVLDAACDKILILLMCAAIFSLLLSFFSNVNEADNNEPSESWIEGVAILLSVFIVIIVTATNDYSKEKKFRGLQKKVNDDVKVCVIRDSNLCQIHIADLVVGDVVQVKYGDLIPADGCLLACNDLKVDESMMTGESDHVRKSLENDLVMFGGSTIMEGSGKMLVLCVGMHSQNGLITKLLKNKLEPSKVVKNNDSVTSNEEVTNSDQTILQRKLSGLTNMIGYFGLVSGFVLVFALIGKYILVNFIFADNDLDGNIFSVITNIVILGITVVVVAIPEGLPLAVTISLAYSVMQMTKDNNLVRHLAACETMGNATAICSDKTGTITENKMKAMQCCFNQQFTTALPTYESMYKVTRDLIVEGISVNSAYTSQIKKEKDGVDVQLGNKTECALLGFVVDIGKSYQEIRNAFPEDQLVKVYTFNSTRKAMMTVINLPNGLGYRVYAKGASEIILTRCSYYLVKDDEVQCLRGEEMKYLSNEVIPSMTDDGLRTIGLAYKDYLYKDAKESEYLIDGEIDWEDEVAIREGMTFIGVIGIQDPIRRGVAEAISKCQNAGITVRMVTGDNVGTARTIAVQCGIMKKDDDYLVIESKEFNRRIKDSEGNICQEKLDQLWPRLRVLARAEPTDKYVLVRGMIESKSGGTREVVAVTGDGTNDAPALKKADIGFAMGIAGTDVAKEASDIIITDDNFASLVKAVIWGRNVYDSISKFVQFQLTVNVVAITITIFGSIILPESPLKAVQMLWVNLIMDTFAALALATEKPVSSLLNRKPYGRNAPLVTPLMLKNIVGQAIYQISVLLIALYYDEFLFNYQLIPSVHSSVQHMTCIFNTFVMMTIFNEINSRKIHGERNVFKGIFSNVLFPVIIVGTFGAQFLIVTFGGKWFMVKDLTLRQWGVCVGFGVGSLVWQQILISIPTIKSDPNIKRVVVGKSTVPEHEPMIQMATVDTEAQVTTTEEETMMSPLMRLRLHAFEVRNQLRVIRAFRSDVLNNQSSSGRSIGERIEVLERARCNSENSL